MFTQSFRSAQVQTSEGRFKNKTQDFDQDSMHGRTHGGDIAPPHNVCAKPVCLLNHYSKRP